MGPGQHGVVRGELGQGGGVCGAGRADGRGCVCVVGVGQAGQAGEEVEGMESGMGQGGSRRSWKGGGRSGGVVPEPAQEHVPPK